MCEQFRIIRMSSSKEDGLLNTGTAITAVNILYHRFYYQRWFLNGRIVTVIAIIIEFFSHVDKRKVNIKCVFTLWVPRFLHSSNKCSRGGLFRIECSIIGRFHKLSNVKKCLWEKYFSTIEVFLKTAKPKTRYLH